MESCLYIVRQTYSLGEKKINVDFVGNLVHLFMHLTSEN